LVSYREKIVVFVVIRLSGREWIFIWKRRIEKKNLPMYHTDKERLINCRCVVASAALCIVVIGLVCSLWLALQPPAIVYREVGVRASGTAWDVLSAGDIDPTAVAAYKFDARVQLQVNLDLGLVVGYNLEHVLHFQDNATKTHWRHHTAWLNDSDGGDAWSLKHIRQSAYRLANETVYHLVNCEEIMMPRLYDTFQVDAAEQRAIQFFLPLLNRGLHAVVSQLEVANENDTSVAAEPPLSDPLDASLLGCTVTDDGTTQIVLPLPFSSATTTSTITVQGTTDTSPDDPVVACREELLGNGLCDKACNSALWRWDGGDCCRQTRVNHPPNENAYDCRSGPRVLLLHGASWAVKDSERLDLQFSDTTPSIAADTRKKLWGILPDRLQDFVSQIIFNSHDTVTRDWSDKDLQLAYYSKAKQVYDTGGSIFAHAFANLVLAGACHDQGLCAIKWNAIAPGFRGMSTLDLAWPVRGLAVDLNTTSVKSMKVGYRNLTSGFLASMVTEKALVRATLCGKSAFGTGGLVGTELAYLTRLRFGHQFTNQSDGVVLQRECIGNTTTLVGLNHQDLAGVVFEKAKPDLTVLFDWFVQQLKR
jgi:hypothetical protein